VLDRSMQYSRETRLHAALHTWPRCYRERNKMPREIARGMMHYSVHAPASIDRIITAPDQSPVTIADSTRALEKERTRAR